MSFHNDQDFVILATPEDPLTPWVNQGLTLALALVIALTFVLTLTLVIALTFVLTLTLTLTRNLTHNQGNWNGSQDKCAVVGEVVRT